MRSALVAAIIVLLTMCSSAFAEQAPLNLNATPVSFPAVGQKALEVAPEYWGTNACPGGFTEIAAPSVVLESSMGAAPGRCVIFWDPKAAPTSPLEWCTDVLHEDGHIIGRGHDRDPWSAMYGGPRILKLSGPFKAESSSQGFCYGRGFYRTWKPVGVLAP